MIHGCRRIKGSARRVAFTVDTADHPPFPHTVRDLSAVWALWQQLIAAYKCPTGTIAIHIRRARNGWEDAVLFELPNDAIASERAGRSCTSSKVPRTPATACCAPR
jgi:hypothetical protein